MNEKTSSIFSVVFAVPWCCVLPAGLAVAGLAGTAAMKIILMKYAPVFLVLSAVFLGRANYLVHIKKQGNRASHIIVWISTLAAVGLGSVWFQEL
ncbi:hypothetical protein UZ36_05410 [Candidatus Nitromaritima sp. SCGC AAA799-C22]|nr:hypothetical protein UZ36_05410 [Candidatus Nitromaritima sp. SCGC AAA799-C22]